MNPDSDKMALLEAIAQQQKINLYERFTEESASDIVNLSIQTLRRIRARGEVAFIRVSERRVEYFGFQIVEYLLSKIEEAKCPATTQNESKPLLTGYQSNPVVPRGAEHGLIPKPDKHAEYLSGLRVLSKRNND